MTIPTTLHSAVSPDGTVIGFTSTGSGRPLVLVHGGTADRHRWAPVLPLLERGHRVHAVDRRGRGLSTDGAHYTIEREYEDVAALVGALARESGGGVDVLGHSYGALCVLGALGLTPHLRRVVLYEPPLNAAGRIPAEVVSELDSLLARGHNAEAVAYFFRTVVGMPERELDLLRALPAWRDRVAAAPTIARELRAADAYRFDPERLRAVTCPVLLLLGGDSPAPVQEDARVLARALRGSRVHVLPGQQHVAIDTAPELFARAVTAFLDQRQGVQQS
ncbi:alpha/beta fold hydrolase [Nocardiopsis valliformis]|uniref:alpha/beta fold hydrolase n=1 Tax=Nocardiopsis valliformis TaxID=239974 RepID=UPI00034747D4|nr:alpha/beta hydrolase [Nocardiopsis valliformis]